MRRLRPIRARVGPLGGVAPGHGAVTVSHGKEKVSPEHGMTVVLPATLIRGCMPYPLEGAWNASWNGGAEDPSVLGAVVALLCGIDAGSGPKAMEHASCKRKVELARHYQARHCRHPHRSAPHRQWRQDRRQWRTTAELRRSWIKAASRRRWPGVSGGLCR